MVRDYHQTPVANHWIAPWRPWRPLPRKSRRTGARRLLGLSLMGVLLLGLLIGGSRASRRVLRLPYFEISEVHVEGNAQVSAEDIVASLDLGGRESLFGVNLPDLAERITRHPWVKEATLSRRPPRTLVVRVVERMPAFLLLVGREGVTERPAYLVSADGVVLEELTREEAPPLLTLRLVEPRPYQVGGQALDPEIAQGLSLWKEIEGIEVYPAMTPPEISLEQDGSYTVRPGGSDRGVIRLRGAGGDESLRRLLAVLAMTGTRLDQYDYVDLRFGQKVITKPLNEGRSKGVQGERHRRRA